MKMGIGAWWREHKRQRDIKRVREGFAFLGFPLEDVSDEELEEGIVRAHDAARASMLSMAEVAAGWDRLRLII